MRIWFPSTLPCSIIVRPSRIASTRSRVISTRICSAPRTSSLSPIKTLTCGITIDERAAKIARTSSSSRSVNADRRCNEQSRLQRGSEQSINNATKRHALGKEIPFAIHCATSTVPFTQRVVESPRNSTRHNQSTAVIMSLRPQCRRRY